MAAIAWLRRPRPPGPARAAHLCVFTDGAIRRAAGKTGLGVVVLDERGRLLACWGRCAGPLTNNEAEYEAILFALERLRPWRPATILLFSDSQVVVDQASGRAATHTPGLQQQLARLRALLVTLPPVTFRHVPRQRNRLADALANDVVDGYVRDEG